MNKKTGFFLWILMIMNCFSFMTNAVAQNTEQFAIIGTRFEGKGNITPDTGVYVLLTTGGATGGNQDKVLGLYEGQSDANGDYEFSIPVSMARITAGKTVTAFVRYGENELREFNYVIMTEAEKASFIEDVLKPVASAAEMLSVLMDGQNQEKLLLTGLDVALLSEMSNGGQANVAKIFYDSGICRTGSVMAVVSGFESALKIGVIGSGAMTTINALNKYEKYYNLAFGNITWQTVQADSKLSAWVAAVLEKGALYSSISAINTRFAEANALYALNNADNYKALPALLEAYKDTLGITGTSDYADFLKSDYKTAASKSLYGYLYAAPADSVATFRTYLANAVAAAKNASGSSGSSGSSGGGGGSVIQVPQVDTASIMKELENADSSTTSSFVDVSASDYAYTAVGYLFEKKIISGYEDGTFKPDQSVAREEFLKMLIGSMEMVTDGGLTPFADVSSGQWYSPYVATAWKHELVKGITDDLFGLGLEVSREDAAVMIYRAIGINDKAIGKNREYQSFIDEDDIHDYAKEAVQALYKAQLMNGSDGRFNPQSAASRREIAVMLYNFMKQGGSGSE